MPIWVTSGAADGEGKKTEEGTMMLTPGPQSSFVTVTDPPEAQTVTSATTEEVSDILTNCKI
jgi:hypothetical protein